MKTRNFLWLSLALGTTLPSCAPKPKEEAEDKKQPNLLYIFPDQYRLQAMGIWSDSDFQEALRTVVDPVQTPNIDRLARQGVLFTQATSTHPVSSPHRAMLLSGMYPSQNGIEDINCKMGRTQELHQDIVCFTDVLAEAGYETAYLGKTHWHRTEAVFDKDSTFVGTTEAPGGYSIGLFDTYVPAGPSRHSNKYWFQQLNDSHYNAVAYSNRPELVGGKKDGEVYRPHEFTTYTEANAAIRFLENKEGERDASKPFSIFWAINPPHPPYYAVGRDCDAELYNELYRDMDVKELLNRPNVDLTAKTGDYSNDGEVGLARNAGIYFTLIKSIDTEIGRVLDKLEEIGEADNTIIVFTSDHGEMMGSHSLTGKNSIHDESFLVPFIITYPEVIKPRLDNLLLGSVDIMPTMLSMMGLGDKIPATVAGVDYAEGIVTGDYTNTPKPHTALYLRMDRKGVRSDRYAYAVDEKGTYELFDNLADPYQMNSLKLEEIPAEEATRLKSDLGMWLKKAQDGWFTKRLNSDNGLIIYPAN